MKVYGWEELGECCYGITTTNEFSRKCVLAAETEDNGLLSLRDEDGYLISGCWFKTFSQAKASQIETFQFGISW